MQIENHNHAVDARFTDFAVLNGVALSSDDGIAADTGHVRLCGAFED